MLLLSPSALIACSFLCVSWLAAQGPAGDEADPIGLTIVVADIGQGSGMVIRAPDGTVHVIDAGEDGRGNAVMVPLIRSLNPTAYGYTFLTHYHLDHSGGLDEILTASPALPFQLCYDRGDTAASGSAYTTYRTAAGSRRRVPALGQVLALGGGATLRVLAHNGNVVGGATVPVAGQNQEENARSLAMRIDYGNFSMWVAGDLTGGGVSGGSATPDVESPAALACGDVDVYICNHHGSVTSSNANLWARLSPDLAIASNGTDNPYGHPHDETIALINAAARCVPLLNTTVGARKFGYGVSRGNLTITTDGQRYRVRTPTIGWLDFFVDEVTNRAPAPGDLVISEFHRDPAVVPDSSGEYVELTNVGAAPVSLRGLRLATTSGSVTFGANLALYPGRPLTLNADGDDSRNGGLPLGVTWPRSVIALNNSGTTLALQTSTGTLDSVTYTSSFPGGSGIASERRNLLAGATAANFVGATLAFGSGDRGSPGRRNAGDTTDAPGRIRVEVSASELVLRASAISDGSKLSIVGLAFGNTGFPFLGGVIPIDPDVLFLTTTNLPGFVSFLPAEGYRSFTFVLPVPNPLAGTPAFAAHVVIDLAVPSLGAVSTAAPFVFQ